MIKYILMIALLVPAYSSADCGLLDGTYGDGSVEVRGTSWSVSADRGALFLTFNRQYLYGCDAYRVAGSDASRKSILALALHARANSIPVEIEYDFPMSGEICDIISIQSKASCY